MGCTASKLDNEDNVRRCKERRHLMKQVVYSRHHLTAAHSDYLLSLRLTGSALTSFAVGEPLSISDDTPPVLLRPTFSTSNATGGYAPQPPVPHPRPPPPTFYPSPTIASSKLPHILSESSPSATPIPPHKSSSFSKFPHFSKYPHIPENSTYSSTPSQASSIWDWENLCPPSPPPSDFFRRDEDEEDPPRFHSHQQNDDNSTEREEVHCSEWGDHYSSHSSSISSDNEHENDTPHQGEDDYDRYSKSETATLSNCGSRADTAIPHSTIGEKFSKKERSEMGSSVEGDISDMKMVVRHGDLVEIVKAIEEYFNKAAVSGEAVSDLLEIGRAHFDSSFRQLKKTVYHSNSVLSNLSSTWTSKPPLAIRYRLDTGTLQDLSGGKSHGSTLERLLAWEKKLYQEVKVLP